MNAVILAAGKGSRLGDITASVPKPLLRVKGTPVLEHLVRLCAAHGVQNLFVNTHYLAEQVRGALGDGSAFGCSITYSYEETLLGTAGALNNFRDRLEGGDFFVLYGDNYMDYDLASLMRVHRRHGGVATVALYERDEVSQSGIAVLDETSRIQRFIEKPTPEQAVSRLVNCGLYACSPAMLEHIPPGVSDFGRDVFPALLRSGAPLYGEIMDRPLIPIDTVDMYRQAQDEHGTER